MDMNVDKNEPIIEKPDSTSSLTHPSVNGEQQRASSLPNTLPNSTEKKKVGYIYSEEMTQHFCLDGHQEQPERIIQIFQAIKNANLLEEMKELSIVIPTKQEVCLVHTEDLWNMVDAIQYMTVEDIEETEDFYHELSVYVNGLGTTHSALLSCGGVIQACMEVVNGTVDKAFAIVRPPGHHAEPDQHMGFCFFNNVAVATKVVQQRTDVKKIMIVDWDVHHGNGTQLAFIDDPSVLYFSLHRYDNGVFYPGGPFGALDSCGEGAGEGYSVNIPWPCAGMGDADYIYSLMKIIMPIATQFNPELVIISAGFDAVEGDPLGQCLVTPVGYSHMTHMLSSLAGGKLVVALEGGYHIEATASAALAVTKTLVLGYPPEPLPPMMATPVATETIWMVAREQSKYWSCLDYKELEPREEHGEPGLDTYSISELLKAHRQQYLGSTCGMLQLPLVRDTFEKGFGAQVFCSSDIQSNKMLIVLVHEFGSIRREMATHLSCEVDIHKSYLLDEAKVLVQWAHQQGYALLDVNVHPKSLPNWSDLDPQRDDLKRSVLAYLWDNFIQLTSIEQVIFIGHGQACKAMMNLIPHRFSQFKTKVKGMIQIVDYHNLPSVPKLLDTRSWYRERSCVIVPVDHPVLDVNMAKRNFRRHGEVHVISEPDTTRMISLGMPQIAQFIEGKFRRRSG